MGANIILDRLPDRVEIGGKEYQIFSDFRTSILFETMMRSELSDKEKLTQMLHIYYPVVPKETGEAIKKIMWFYSCGKEQQENKKNRTKQEFQRHKVSYSFEQDAPYIYAACRKEYGINLQTIPSTDLHWWEFNALFDALPEECRIKKIMYWRTCDTAGMSKKEVKGSIHSQILTVFFVPLLMAILHVTVAFKPITKLPLVFNPADTHLSMMCTIGVSAVFAVFYVIVFAITSREYYKIVK